MAYSNDCTLLTVKANAFFAARHKHDRSCHSVREGCSIRQKIASGYLNVTLFSSKFEGSGGEIVALGDSCECLFQTTCNSLVNIGNYSFVLCSFELEGGSSKS